MLFASALKIYFASIEYLQLSLKHKITWYLTCTVIIQYVRGLKCKKEFFYKSLPLQISIRISFWMVLNVTVALRGHSHFASRIKSDGLQLASR